MKIEEMTTKRDCDITIGYDDHSSMFSIDRTHLKKILYMNDDDEINDYIINNGKRRGVWDPDQIDGGDIFFDAMTGDVEGLHTQIRDFLEETR